MIKVWNWVFDAVIPACLAAAAVSALVEANNAHEKAEWDKSGVSVIFGLGMFVALFMYLDWNRRNYTK